MSKPRQQFYYALLFWGNLAARRLYAVRRLYTVPLGHGVTVRLVCRGRDVSPRHSVYPGTLGLSSVNKLVPID